MALGNTLLGDDLFVAGGPAEPVMLGSDGTINAPVASGSDNVPRIVALFLIVALAIIVAVHLGGLRAMVTVGG
jgi:hypothetical protein